MGRIADYFARRRLRKSAKRAPDVSTVIDDPVERTLPRMSPEDEALLFFEREKAFSPPPPRPVVDVAFDELPGISREFGEETSVDELYAHHIGQKFFRERDTTLRGRMVTVSILGTLRDGNIAWVGNDSASYGHCDVSFLGRDEVGSGDEIRARVVSHSWGHSLEAVDPNSYLTAEEIDERRQRPLGDAEEEGTPAPELVHGTWRAHLQPGDVILTHIPFGDTYGHRVGGAIAKNRPAAFVRWEHDYAVVRPIYSPDTYVARSGLGTELLERGCLDHLSYIRKVAFDIHPDCLLKKLGRLGDRDLIGLGFTRGAVTPPPALPVAGPPPGPVEPRPPVDPGPSTAIVFSKETFGWKKQFREVATDLMLTSDASNGDEALDSLLLCLTNDLEVNDALRSEGVDLAAIGDALQMVCSPRGISTRGKKLGVRLSESVARINGLHQLGLEVRPTGEEGVVHLYRS